MSVKINIPIFLQSLTNNVKVAKVTGSTIGECIDDFIKQFPGIEKELFDKDGNLHYHLTVWINRESTSPDMMAKTINDGDELDIIRLHMGG